MTALNDTVPFDEVHVVVAHKARATLRVGDIFLKVDPDRAGIDAEVEAMDLAPVPTPKVLWCQPPVLAITAVSGVALGHYGVSSPVGPTSWAAAGAAVRALHDAPPPPGPGKRLDELAGRLARDCAWLLENEVISADVVDYNRTLAELVLRPYTPVFVHGDLQPDHIFVIDSAVTGVIDWSGAGPGDAMYDLAVLTLGHPEHLDDVANGYGEGVDLDMIRSWWSYRSLTAIPWLVKHGFGDATAYPETAVLLAAMR